MVFGWWCEVVEKNKVENRDVGSNIARKKGVIRCASGLWWLEKQGFAMVKNGEGDN